MKAARRSRWGLLLIQLNRSNNNSSSGNSLNQRATQNKTVLNCEATRAFAPLRDQVADDPLARCAGYSATLARPEHGLP